jgi:hypothetical protein
MPQNDIATQSPGEEGFVVPLRQAQGDHGGLVELSAERLGRGAIYIDQLSKNLLD